MKSMIETKLSPVDKIKSNFGMCISLEGCRILHEMNLPG